MYKYKGCLLKFTHKCAWYQIKLSLIWVICQYHHDKKISFLERSWKVALYSVKKKIRFFLEKRLYSSLKDIGRKSLCELGLGVYFWEALRRDWTIFSKSFSLNEEESKGINMEGEGGKPSIGERELSTKASETVTNLNASNTDLVHFNLASHLGSRMSFPAWEGFLFQPLNTFLAFQRFFLLFSFFLQFLNLALTDSRRETRPSFSSSRQFNIWPERCFLSWTSLIDINVLLLKVPIRFFRRVTRPNNVEACVWISETWFEKLGVTTAILSALQLQTPI